MQCNYLPRKNYPASALPRPCLKRYAALGCLLGLSCSRADGLPWLRVETMLLFGLVLASLVRLRPRSSLALEKNRDRNTITSVKYASCSSIKAYMDKK
ncbi:uncharacterized protein K460DRAFT_107877 [Cucurbitaria berberidis CBS 394.84]|uniref:Uncharacterized protein n=1 Tax=Cucurbitaria berberidis CBS 394.84 TaxID=1168544 RepID=A0A9P4L8L5_9PLEO|nr:uncharacterized protein K460DRAFT_107877 [Cucurbitaria berberidis CBS 394.84]KAF1845359.1 hypothetical protein K460DRAFT_107877 [Cucurbitaria berberidis CBS 394.84]